MVLLIHFAHVDSPSSPIGKGNESVGSEVLGHSHDSRRRCGMAGESVTSVTGRVAVRAGMVVPSRAAVLLLVA